MKSWETCFENQLAWEPEPLKRDLIFCFDGAISGTIPETRNNVLFNMNSVQDVCKKIAAFKRFPSGKCSWSKRTTQDYTVEHNWGILI